LGKRKPSEVTNEGDETEDETEQSGEGDETEEGKITFAVLVNSVRACPTLVQL
jgi:hypothetical protein